MLLGPSGQNIYPEEIEAKLINMKLVSDCLVVSRNNQVVALVHPDYKMAEDNRMGTADIVKQMDQNRQLLNKQLPAFEQVAKIIIQREEFEKTPKKSIKRFLYESAN
jgi:long-chain acyl-CoA synthetase